MAKKIPSIFDLGELKSLGPEELKKIRKEAQELREAMKEEREQPPESPTGVCVCCGGTVKGHYANECLVSSREIIYGPGGRHQYGWVFKGYHCEQCGLKYEFPPPKKA
jgi:hypothetical protein